MKHETLDATMAAVGTKATYAGAGMSGLGWFLSNEFFGLAGVLIALTGVLVNAYYRCQDNIRAAREHALRVELLRGRRTDTGLGELGDDE